MDRLSLTDVLGASVIALAFYFPAVILARLALWSAATRLGRVRRAAEALTEDVVTLLRKGEHARACDVASSRGTPFAIGIVRVLQVLFDRRNRVVEELGEQWRQGPSQGAAMGYGCFLWLLMVVATVCSLGFVLLSIGLAQVRGLDRALSVLFAFLASGIGMRVLWSVRQALIEEQVELGASCYALLRRVASALEAQETV